MMNFKVFDRIFYLKIFWEVQSNGIYQISKGIAPEKFLKFLQAIWDQHCKAVTAVHAICAMFKACGVFGPKIFPEWCP